NSLSAKVSCWLIRLLILGSGYNTMISHLGLIRTFPKMIGLIIGKIGHDKAMSQGVNGLSKRDLLSGFVTGFKVSCPNCGKCNWE
ncbi:hypothetical protein AB8R75_28185, partial [Klebsiella quasipneumoniae subsp. similipneumoniae]|uniref:hypothetical protein n=1 Tax=Klebsiella quasipneumoniae TaxID=1463165 RepID=UPI0038D0213C